jgi:hypothetical protein
VLFNTKKNKIESSLHKYITPLLKALLNVKTYENFFSFYFYDTQWLSQEEEKRKETNRSVISPKNLNSCRVLSF